ncbi:MAG TPA: hypothetical protein VNO14_19085 [Blastocatellia bacterium]|nr:hypothetical protein [Blastocatellia bacterium]
MMPKKAKGLIIGLFLISMLLVGVGGTTANAQGKKRARKPPRVIVYRIYDPFWYRHYDPFWDPFYYSRYRVVDPIAYQRERGYSEGKDEGEEDAKKGRPANPTGHEDYLESDSIHFREAFVQGYNAGYQEELAEIREEMREKAQKMRERRGE